MDTTRLLQLAAHYAAMILVWLLVLTALRAVVGELSFCISNFTPQNDSENTQKEYAALVKPLSPDRTRRGMHVVFTYQSQEVPRRE